MPESATGITFSFDYVSLSTATGALIVFPTVQMTIQISIRLVISSVMILGGLGLVLVGREVLVLLKRTNFNSTAS